MTENREPGSRLEQKLKTYYEVLPRKDFLPSLKKDLLARVPAYKSSDKKPLTFPAFFCRPAFALVAFVIILCLLGFTTPPGRALAQQILHFFTRALGNTLPLPPGQVFEPVPSTTPEPTYTLALQPADQVVQTTPTTKPTLALNPEELKDMSIVEAEAAVGFGLYEPVRLPLDYRLTRILYDPIHQSVSMWYASPRAGSGEFFQVTQGRNLASLSVGLDAKVETVAIGEHSAEFVRGGWFVANGASESTWESQAGVYTLRWQAEDVTISIEFLMNDSFLPAYLERDEMLAVAQNLVRCDPAGDYTCEVSQAAAAAGFTPWQFPAAPAGLSFNHVDYRPGLTVLQYGSGMDQLTILQSTRDFAAQEEDSWFSVPADAIQGVDVAGQPGEYVKGQFMAQPGESEAGWNPDSPLERLRWKSDAWWFQIIKIGGTSLQSQPMADMAGQLTGTVAQVQADRQQNTLPEDGLPDAYTDVTDLETAAGFDVLEPGVLPDGLPFSHARYIPDSGGVMLFYGSFAPDKLHANGPILVVNETPRQANEVNVGSSYPPEAVQPVEVNGYSGRFITGMMETVQSEPGQPAPAPLWNPDAGVLTLAWNTDEMTFTVNFNSSGQGGARVSAQDLLRIAGSLH
jgi:hypothetical protein